MMTTSWNERHFLGVRMIPPPIEPDVHNATTSTLRGNLYKIGIGREEPSSLSLYGNSPQPQNVTAQYSVNGSDFSNKRPFLKKDGSLRRESSLNSYSAFHEVRKEKRTKSRSSCTQLRKQPYHKREFWSVVVNDAVPGKVRKKFSSNSVSSVNSLSQDFPTACTEYNILDCNQLGKKSQSSLETSMISEDPITPLSNERPFRCELCLTEFKRKYDLVQHIAAVHEKRRPFRCTTCNSSFAHKGTLTKHVRTVHLGIKPFRCKLCSTRFSERGNLNKHLQRIHNPGRPILSSSRP